jgi:membrane protease YdiL (CAAX protease family)
MKRQEIVFVCARHVVKALDSCRRQGAERGFSDTCGDQNRFVRLHWSDLAGEATVGAAVLFTLLSAVKDATSWSSCSIVSRIPCSMPDTRAPSSAGTGWYGLAVVSANIIGLSVVLTWLRLKSGSLWTAVILHASHNHFIQGFFDPMTAYTGRAKYILGEFGIGFTLVVAVLAAYFWMRRAEVAQPRNGL